MELELGLKITKTRDDIASISEYELAKDREGPVFKSRETNTMFILTAHLKGYKKNNIDIKISEDGSKITIKGKKPVQEMLMMGWVMHRKEVGVTGFNKVFKIPDGVNLDRIKAKYDEEEWFLNIVMPKLVKGICGARIEEVKEEESDRGRSELEKSEADHILRNVGETSQKGSKESDGQEMEGSESFMEEKEGGMSVKMFDDANREINKEKMQKEVEEYKLGTEDENQESVRQKVGKEGYEVMKTSELEQNVDECISQKVTDTNQDREFEVPKMKDSKNVEKKKGGVPEKMLDDANRVVNKERMQKEVEDSKLAIEDGIGESVREKVGKEGYEVMKTSELEQNFDDSISQKIAATKQARELEVPKIKDSKNVEKKEGGVSEKMFDDAKREINKESMQRKVEEFKLGIEDGSAESVREKAGKEGYGVMKISELEKNVDRSQDRESKVQKTGDSKNVEKKERAVSDKMLDDANTEINKERMQKEVQESKLGIEDGTGESVREKVKKEGYEVMKTSELEQNVEESIAHKIADTSQDKGSKVDKMKDSKIVYNEQGGVYDKMFDDARGDINNERMKREVEESKMGIEDGSSESVREKVGKEGYEVMKTSELEQNVDESILQKIADARDKEFEVPKLKDGKNVVKKEGEVPDKMLDYASGYITGDTIKKEIEESKLRIEDGKVKGMREKVGKTAYEAMETSEMKQDVGAGIPQNIGDTSRDKESKVQKAEDDGSLVEKKEKLVSDKMLDDTNGDKIREMIQKEIEGSKLGIEDGDGKSVKKKVGKEVCEAVKSSELEQNVGACITQIIGDTSRGVSEEPVIQERGQAKCTVEKIEREESGKIPIKAYGFTEEETYGESKQKEVGDPKCETEDRLKESLIDSSREPLEAMKTSELDQNVADDHIPGNIGGIRQEVFKESRIQQGEKTESTEKKMDGGESERTPVKANNDIKETLLGDIIQKDIKKPMIETKNGDQRCFREKDGKEGFDAGITVSEEFPKQLPRDTLEESEGLTVPKMQETIDVKEEMVKRKGKEIEYFVEKGEGERPKRMHVETKKGMTKETMHKEIERIKNGIKDSDQPVLENTVKGRFEISNSTTEELQKQIGELDGSKGFKVSREEELDEAIKEAMAETESLMEKGELEGEESQKRIEEASRVIEKSTVNETLQKETEESNIERKARDVFEELGNVQEKLPKYVGKTIAQNEKDKIEYGTEKLKGEGSVKKHVEPNEVFEEDTAGDKIGKDIRKHKLDSSDQLRRKGNVDNGRFDESKRQKFPQKGETEGLKEEGVKIEQSGKKVNEDKNEKIQLEANGGIRKDITRDPKTQTKEKEQHRLQEEISTGRFQGSKAAKEEFPTKMVDSPANTRKRIKDTRIEEKELVKQKSEEKMENKEEVKEEGAEIAQEVKKVEGEKYEKIQVEASGLKDDITKETTLKETEDPKIPIKEKDQQCLQEEMSKGRYKASTTPREFPMQIVDSLSKTRGEPKDKELEEEKEVKKELVKQKSEERMENKDVKEEGAEIAQVLKKVKEEKYEKIQAEASGLKDDIPKETTWKETEEPKIPIKENDQHCLQEEMSKGRYESSTTARDFPMKIVDSPSKTTGEPKDKELEEEKEVKEEVAKRNSEETKVVESTTKVKIQESDGERITQTLKRVPEEKHPKTLAIRTPEKELQSTKGATTRAKVASMGFKEVEQGSEKEKEQKTELLPPKIQSKETHESKIGSAVQGILKPEKATDVGEGEQYTCDTKSNKEVPSIEDQVAKPLSALAAPYFPSAQKSEVEEKAKLYEGSKARYGTFLESQKEDPTEEEMQNLIEMENQESKQTETLGPKIPLEKHPKKEGQVITKDEFHKGQKVRETIYEEIEGPKHKIDNRAQQYVPRDVGKGIGKAEIIEKETPKEEYVADAGPIAERMETKGDLKAPLEREEYITQNVKDGKPRIQEEILQADIEKVDKSKCIPESLKTTQEKEYPIKSEVVEEEAESLEPISSFPSVTSTGIKEAGPKNEIEELQQKELSPLTAEIKSKAPLELEKPRMHWKFPKTKVHVPVPETGDRKQYSYGTEEIKAPKISACQGPKPSKLQGPTLTQQFIDEENRKSENVVEAHETTKESPDENIVANEEIDRFPPQVVKNQCFEEEQKVDRQKGALGQRGFKEINQEKTKGPKVLIEDRDQHYVQENNDKKGYQTTKAAEQELLKQEHREEVLEKREGSKVEKSEEAREASRSRQQLKIERGKTTQTAEEKKPKMRDITPEVEKASGFKQVVVKMHETKERESEVTSQTGLEPPTTVEITPNKGIERKEPRELSWPSMDYKIPKIDEVQQEKERERPIHTLEATTSKEKGLGKATATHSKAKSNVELEPIADIDKPQVNKLPSPAIETLSNEPCELDKFSMKEDDSKVENSVQVLKGKESIQSIKGTTKIKAGKEVEQVETPQPDSSADQQCINKKQEENHGTNEIEEKSNEQVLEEQKESKEEASGGKKDGTKLSKKLLVPLVIAGSAFLVSLVVIFVRHRRAKKSITR